MAFQDRQKVQILGEMLIWIRYISENRCEAQNALQNETQITTGMAVVARIKNKIHDLSQADIQMLINEFLKDRPNQVFIKEIFLRNGLDYTGDMMVEMATVLGSISKPRAASNLELKNSER